MGHGEGEGVRDVRGPGRRKSWAWGALVVTSAEREGTSMTHRCPVGDTDAERKQREEQGPGEGRVCHLSQDLHEDIHWALPQISFGTV